MSARRGDPFLQHVEGLVADHGVDAAGDEAGGLLDHHHFFAHALADFDRSGQRSSSVSSARTTSSKLHLVHGIEEVHADALFGAVGDAGNFGHAER